MVCGQLFAQTATVSVSPFFAGQRRSPTPGSFFFSGNPNLGGNHRLSLFDRTPFLNPFFYGRSRFGRNHFARDRFGVGRAGYGRTVNFGDSAMWTDYFGNGYGYLYSINPQSTPPSNPYPEEYRVKGKLANDVDVLTGKSSQSTYGDQEAAPSTPEPKP
jgi:hypothetical protein